MYDPKAMTAHEIMMTDRTIAKMIPGFNGALEPCFSNPPPFGSVVLVAVVAVVCSVVLVVVVVVVVLDVFTMMLAGVVSDTLPMVLVGFVPEDSPAFVAFEYGAFSVTSVVTVPDSAVVLAAVAPGVCSAVLAVAVSVVPPVVPVVFEYGVPSVASVVAVPVSAVVLAAFAPRVCSTVLAVAVSVVPPVVPVVFEYGVPSVASVVLFASDAPPVLLAGVVAFASPSELVECGAVAVVLAEVLSS